LGHGEGESEFIRGMRKRGRGKERKTKIENRKEKIENRKTEKRGKPQRHPSASLRAGRGTEKYIEKTGSEPAAR
jgi:hypothetical protein